MKGYTSENIRNIRMMTDMVELEQSSLELVHQKLFLSVEHTMILILRLARRFLSIQTRPILIFRQE